MLSFGILILSESILNLLASMFPVPRVLLFSSLTLLKIILAVTNGIYSIVLKVYNEVEFTLKNVENSHFSQNIRQSGMGSFNNLRLSTTRAYKLQNQAGGIENSSQSLRSSQIAKYAANTKIFVKASDGSCLQMDTFYRKIKCQLNESNFNKKETSEWDLQNSPSKFVEHNKKIQYFPSFATPLPQRKSVDTTSHNRTIESAYIHENKTIQTSETQHFKNQENYSDLCKTKNVMHSTYVTEDKLHQSERDDHNVESNGNVIKHPGDAGETNIEEAKASYEIDDGSFRSCSPMDQADIKERENGSGGSLDDLMFQGEEIRLGTDSNDGSEVYTRSQAADLENCVTDCSDSPIKDENLKDTSNACKVQAVQEAEKAVENIQHGESATEKAWPSTSTYKSRDKFVELLPSCSESVQLQLKSGKAAFSRFLVEMEPVIAEVEQAIVVLCKLWHASSLTLRSRFLHAIYSAFTKLSEKSLHLEMPYHSFITLYVNDMVYIIEEIQDTKVPVRIENSHEDSSFTDSIRLRLMQKREFLFSDIEGLNKYFNGEKEPIRKNKTSRKSKSRNKRKR